MIYNDRYIPLLNNKSRYLVIGGGSSSGKSYFIAQKILKRCFTNKKQGFLCLRTTGPTARISVWEIFKQVLRDNDMIGYANVNETQMKITFPNGTFILCRGLDELNKVKSIVGVTSQWLEEAIEFSEKEFRELQRRMRAVRNTYKQTIISFNPDDFYHWIKELFYDPTNEGNASYKAKSTALMTTIEDNKFATKEDYEELEALKNRDITEYNVYRKGEWSAPSNVIYTHFDIIDADKYPKSFDEVIYGMDFGYTDPCAIVEIGILDQEYYIKELLYESGLTASAMFQKTKALIPRDALIYADSNRPEYIDEMQSDFHVIGADKGAGSVVNGIDAVKDVICHLEGNSHNLIRESRNYRKREVNGMIIDEPVKRNDHLMDALRYPISHHKYPRLISGLR